MPRAAKVSTVVRSWRMDRARRSSRSNPAPSPARELLSFGELGALSKSADPPLLDRHENETPHPAVMP
jgi:hypothetical protein